MWCGDGGAVADGLGRVLVGEGGCVVGAVDLQFGVVLAPSGINAQIEV